LIALDTNVLVRILTADDLVQYTQARKFIEAHCIEEGEEPRLYVPAVVICEIAWVLATVHNYHRDLIRMSIQGLLESRDLVFGERATVEAALEAFAKGRGEFADYFIREGALRAGCESVATFEKRLHGETAFHAP
jgi:predicted nucleic-acid-binding protein